MESKAPKNSIECNLAKEALQECEQKFNSLLDTLAEGVIIHDKFKIIDSNRGYAAMFGYNHQEIIGRDILGFIEPQSRDIVMKNLLKGDEMPFRIRALRKDGSTFATELCSRSIPHRDCRLNLTVFRETGAGAAEPENDSPAVNERLGVFFDYSPDAYYLADATGKFIDVNKSAEKLFGQVREDIIGKSFLKLNLLTPDQIHKAAKHLVFNIFGNPTEPEEYVIHRKDGSRIPVEINILPVQKNSQKMLFGIVRNITEKKRSADALRRAIKEIEILVEERRAKEREAASARKTKKRT